MKVLVLNSGSSSIKFDLFDAANLAALASGILERIGQPDGRLVQRLRDPAGRLEESARPASVGGHREGFERVLEALARSAALRGAGDLAGVGHRVVHGGPVFEEPTLVDATVVEAIREATRLAPLHNAANLMGIEAALEAYPGVPQVAVFDTAFHRTMPPRAWRYALPAALCAEHGVRRYGFHGTSHQYVARRAARLLGRPLESLDLITLHLGNGASATAIQAGRSIDTSMGMTPLEGLVMGTRCGDLDPAIPLYLSRKTGMSPETLEQVLKEESGLVGLCGASDVREVVERAGAGDPDSRLALDVYCYRVRKYVGAYLAALGRADALVFTAGVGENSALVRRHCCEGLEGLGIVLDEERNASASREEREIQADGSPVKVLVIPTDEALEIAQRTLECVRGRDRAAPPGGPEERTP
jgi:acetate kinase